MCGDHREELASHRAGQEGLPEGPEGQAGVMAGEGPQRRDP